MDCLVSLSQAFQSQPYLVRDQCGWKHLIFVIPRVNQRSQTLRLWDIQLYKPSCQLMRQRSPGQNCVVCFLFFSLGSLPPL